MNVIKGPLAIGVSFAAYDFVVRLLRSILRNTKLSNS